MNLFISILKHEIIKLRFLLIFLPFVSTIAFTILSVFAFYQLTLSFDYSELTTLEFLNNQGISIISNKQNSNANQITWLANQDRIAFIMIYFTGISFFLNNVFIQDIHNKTALFYALLPINPVMNIAIKLLISLFIFPFMILASYVFLKLIVLILVTMLSSEASNINLFASIISTIFLQSKAILISFLYFLSLLPLMLVLFLASLNYKNPMSIIVGFSGLMLILFANVLFESNLLGEIIFQSIISPSYQIWVKTQVSPWQVISQLLLSTGFYIGLIISAVLFYLVQKSYYQKL